MATATGPKGKAIVVEDFDGTTICICPTEVRATLVAEALNLATGIILQKTNEDK